MEDQVKYDLCWRSISHAMDTVSLLFRNGDMSWRDDRIKEQYYKLLDVVVWFSDREDELKGEKENETNGV